MFLGGTEVAAQTLQQSNMRRYQSAHLLFPEANSTYAALNPGRYPQALNWLLTKVLAWEPGSESSTFGASCDLRQWQQEFLLQKDLAHQAASIRDFWNHCRSRLETGVNAGWRNGLDMLTMKFDPQNHPFLHRVVFELPGGIHLKGLLALKGDQKKRPMIVVRLGIFANVEEFFPERYFLMQLFEQTPFNVLIVENMSGSDFLRDNTGWGFGGYDEGLQNILIARLLKDSKEPISQVVSSLHLLGVSLGGHGVLFGSLLNEMNPGPGGQKLYNSFLGMCPVVNLKESMQQLGQPGVKGSFVDAWISYRLQDLYSRIPALKDYGIGKFLSLQPYFMPTAIHSVVEKYQGGLSYDPSIVLPKGLGNTKDFWHNNHFWPYYRNVHSPVMVLVTQHDALVPVKYNSALFATKEFATMGNDLQVVSFEQGHHCSLPVAYDWEAVSTLLESYFASYTPELRWRTETMDIDMSDQWKKGFTLEHPVTSYQVEWPEKGRFVILKGEARSDSHRESFTLNLPINEFEFHFLDTQLSESEKDMLVRWLRHNLRLEVLAKNGHDSLRVGWRKMQF